MSQTYHLQKIRALLTEGFSEAELRAFCFDTREFRPVHRKLAQLTEPEMIVSHLLEFAERKLLLDALLAWAERENPKQYQQHQPYRVSDVEIKAPALAELAEARAAYITQMIGRHQELDFVGIPELKDRQGLHLDHVFINLQAEVEVASAPTELLETIMQDEQVSIRHLRAIHETIKRRVSVNEALRERPKMVILGDPGAGKTTLLKYITLAFAQNRSDRLDLNGEARLPVFVRLYDYIAKRAGHPGDYSLVDYLYTQAHENLLLDLPAGFFEAELAQGQCCVCLDGLDELGTAGLRREVSTAVASLANRYPRNRYLITSRRVGYEEAPLDRRDFVHHTVLPFGDDDIRRFVQQWYAARERDPATAQRQSSHLIETIMREPRLKDLAANPLMLTIIALVHRIEAELPHERVKLYDKCVTALVETWEQVKRLSGEDRERPYYKKRRQLLEQLAYWLHTQPLESTGGKGRAREVAEGDLRTQIARFLRQDPQLSLDKRQAAQEAETFIAMIKARTGLLIERGEGLYSFAHLTFQEYLAAAYLEYEHADSIDDLWAVIQPHLHDPAWREVILLLLGSLNKFRKHPTALVRRIFESTDVYEDVLHRHLFLAARALADRVIIETRLRETIVEKLLAIVRARELSQDDALEALGTLSNDDQAAAGLLALASDSAMDALVRSAAAQALDRLGQANAAVLVGLLILASDSAVDALVRSAAAQALGRLGQANAAVLVGLLILASDNAVDTLVRRAAAQALGQLGRVDDAVLVGLLVLASDNAVDARVRRAAAQALDQLGRADDAAELLLILARDSAVDAGVRYDAAQALGKLGRADDAAELLLALASDSAVDALVRRAAAQALGQSGRADDTVLAGLLALAHNNVVAAGVRSTAAQALGQLGQADDTTELLLTLVSDSTVYALVRYDAAQALGQLGRADDAAELLLALARDSAVDAGVRRAAAQALGELGQADDAVLAGLLVLACDSVVDVGVRRAAAQALGQLGRADDAAELLLALARDSAVDAGIRRAAAQTLGKLGRADDAAELLLALARDSGVAAGVRSTAAQALGKLGQADYAAELLLALARDSAVDAEVRSTAAQALGQLGQTDDTVLAGLLALTRDSAENAWIRRVAYRSLKALLWKDEG